MVWCSSWNHNVVAIYIGLAKVYRSRKSFPWELFECVASKFIKQIELKECKYYIWDLLYIVIRRSILRHALHIFIVGGNSRFKNILPGFTYYGRLLFLSGSLTIVLNSTIVLHLLSRPVI